MGNAETRRERAHDIHAVASQWVVERRLSADWSEEDQTRLDEWLGQSTSHSVAYWRASHVWQRTDRLAALKAPAANTAQKAQRSRSFRYLPIAAAIGIVAVVGLAFAHNFFQSRYTTYATAVGERKILRLTDGSLIELNTGSVLRLADNQQRGEAILDKGEAYFDIKHNPVQPFLVIAHGRRLVDIGTKFLVRDDGNALRVSMLEGRAALSASETGTGASTELEAGDIAIATLATTKIVRTSRQTIADMAGWRRGQLVFRHVTLAAAVAEFNRYNGTKLSVEDSNVGAKKIYGTFRTTDVSLFATVAQDVLHLKVKHKDDKIVLSN